MYNYTYDQILHYYICSVLFIPISCTLLWHYRGVFCAEEEGSKRTLLIHPCSISLKNGVCHIQITPIEIMCIERGRQFGMQKKLVAIIGLSTHMKRPTSWKWIVSA